MDNHPVHPGRLGQRADKAETLARSALSQTPPNVLVTFSAVSPVIRFFHFPEPVLTFIPAKPQ
jgi:hypothetical protein